MVEERYNEWLNSDVISKKDKRVLKKMSKKEIEESFYKDLEFGTAGIRGVMGLGSSKMNTYTIGKATVGLASYLNKKYKQPSVVVAYDTRNNSKKFAYDTCLILNYYGIKTFLFDEYTSTPELAFAVKYLKCKSGIVITSSHNAKIYNGYKVYNSLGSQIVPPEDDLIIKEINSIKDLKLIKKAIKNNKLFNIVNDEEKNMFLQENKKAIIHEDLIKKYGKDLIITYTSLHGVGIKPMIKLFTDYGLNYNIVKKQCKYDKNFKTAPEPNPEYIENYSLAKKQAKKFNSDVILMSDPDADRIGVMIKSNDNYELLTGDMVGILFAYYIITNKKLKKDDFVVRSVPSSMMIDKIAKKYKIGLKEVLTGCKNIAVEKQKDEKNYLFGYEESLGYVFNISVDDKNAFSSSLAFIEILCYCKKEGITISEYIENMYKKIGYFYNYSCSFVFEGIHGKEKMDSLMDDIRTNKIHFPKYKEKIDYLKSKTLKTNALKFIFDNNSYLTIRPSGTEPKIKLYFGSNNEDKNQSINDLDNLKKKIMPLFK